MSTDTNPPCDIDRVNADLGRSAACLDACAGIANPVATLTLVRRLLRHALAEHISGEDSRDLVSDALRALGDA